MGRSYRDRTRRSEKLFRRAEKVFAGGVNHNARYYEPYPMFVKKAKGQNIWDVDGNKYTDYWMGHMALILGHSPKVVADALAAQVRNGTHYGMGSELSVKLGEMIQEGVPCAEMVRFCNTGAEATMYLVRLARAFTKKRTIIKMAGGWHGYNTELNKGVHAPFDRSESAGILEGEQAFVRTVPFNDLEAAENALREVGDDVAAVFLEPVLGAGGCIPAEREYLAGLRELTLRRGTLLAFDEVITGFRLAYGGAQEHYGVTPDLAAIGKVAGGGLPLGLVCGTREAMSLADPRKKEGFVSIGGGTFSENPLTMTAGLATLKELKSKSPGVYNELNKRGDDLRTQIDSAFRESAVETHTTGLGSLFLTHFGVEPRRAEDVWSSEKEMARRYALMLMENGVFLLPGHPGGVSTCHSKEDLKRLVSLSSRFAKELDPR